MERISNKELKKLIRGRVKFKLLDLDESQKHDIIVSVFKTTKTNTTPSYKKNLGDLDVSVIVDEEIMSISHFKKKVMQQYDIDDVLTTVANNVVRTMKRNIIENME